MQKRFLVFTALVAFMITTMLGCAGGVALPPPDANSGSAKTAAGENGKMVVTMLNVGQGDAIFIDTGTQKVLVDTSDTDERDNLRRELNKLGVKTLDKIILTHPHADHIGGMGMLLDEWEVKEVYDNGMPSTSPVYRGYMKQMKAKNIPRHALKAGDVLTLGDNVTFTVFSPTADTVEKGQVKGYKHEPNNESIVGKLEYGEFTMLFTGDAEKEAEAEMVDAYGSNLTAKILKSPHHGSKTSSSQKFLQTVKPEAALISLGTGNDYGHPHKQTMERYEKQGIKIYRTDEDGAITVTTDGKTYDIKKEK